MYKKISVFLITCFFINFCFCADAIKTEKNHHTIEHINSKKPHKVSYKIDNTLRQKNINNLVLNLCTSSLTNIFNKFPEYANCINRVNDKNNKIFTFGIIPESDAQLKESIGSIPIAYSKFDMSGVYIHNSAIIIPHGLNERTHLESILNLGRKTIENGFHSNLKLDEVIQAGIAHEIGHIFEYCIIQTLEKPPDTIKNEIIDEAKNIDPKFQHFKISEYGETNSKEWFAEVFATLMNGVNSTPLTCAMEKYLHYTAKCFN